MIPILLLLSAAVAMANAKLLPDLWVRAEGQVTCNGVPYTDNRANISLVVKAYGASEAHFFGSNVRVPKMF